MKEDRSPLPEQTSRKSLCKADEARKRDSSERNTDRQLKQLKITKAEFQHDLDVEKYRLYDHSTKCNTKVTSEIFKKISKVRVMIGKECFNGGQRIMIIPFLVDLRIKCEKADIYEGQMV